MQGVGISIEWKLLDVKVHNTLLNYVTDPVSQQRYTPTWMWIWKLTMFF